MRYSSFKSCVIRLFAVLLLVMVFLPVSAQYYMEVYRKDGQKIPYYLSDIDSIRFIYDATASDEYSYVDLGLSVMWATYNVGAHKPEEYGNYFAWGETVSNYQFVNAQSEIPVWNPKSEDYWWSSYKYGSNYNQLTKYCNNSEFGFNSFIDNKTVLDLQDDAANVNWGGKWRMPTMTELEELFDKCTWTWFTMNGVNGYKVTSNVSGYENASIFLPAAGFRYGTSLEYYCTGGNYWTATLCSFYPCYAEGLFFQSTYHSRGSDSRSGIRSVRPVYPTVIEMKMDTSSISLNPDEEIKLTAIVKRDGQVVDFSVQWLSDKPTVATVSDDGVVKCLAEGTALITAEYYGYTATCQVTVTKNSGASYEYVDLGLSVMWATCNVGASKPEDYGDYFAWGETEAKSIYDWSTYKYCKGTYNTITKYCSNISYGDNGFTDTKTTLDPEDDVAHVVWGGSWRMPTQADFDELLNNCDWAWINQNGVLGWKVTSRVDTSCSIFLPAASYHYDSAHGGMGFLGYYWSSSLSTGDPLGAWGIYFNSSDHAELGNSRSYGLSVRPVCSK